MKDLLSFSALVLSVINGVALLRMYIRDRPIIEVSEIHPEIYQWWFKLPDRIVDDVPTRRWGLIAYVGVANKGLRKTTITSWRLLVRAKNWRKIELKPTNLPAPAQSAGTVTKSFPVLGQISPPYDGKMVVDSGESISGMAYYVYEVFGDNHWDPKEKEREIVGTFKAKDVFGGTHRKRIRFRERSVEEIKKIVPEIETVSG